MKLAPVVVTVCFWSFIIAAFSKFMVTEAFPVNWEQEVLDCWTSCCSQKAERSVWRADILHSSAGSDRDDLKSAAYGGKTQNMKPSRRFRCRSGVILSLKPNFNTEKKKVISYLYCGMAFCGGDQNRSDEPHIHADDLFSNQISSLKSHEIF